MTRALLLSVAVFTLSGCAFNQPPLLEEDGQYKPPRQSREARTQQQRDYQQQMAEQQARIAANETPAPVEELPEALRQMQDGPIIPPPENMIPKRDRTENMSDLEAVQQGNEPPPTPVDSIDLAALERILDERGFGAVEGEASEPLAPVMANTQPDELRADEVAPAIEAPTANAPEFAELPPAEQIEPMADRPSAAAPVSGPYFSASAPTAAPATDEAPVQVPENKAEDTRDESAAPVSMPESHTVLEPVAQAPKVAGVAGVITPPRIVGEAAPDAIQGSAAPTVRIPMDVQAQGEPKALSTPFEEQPDAPAALVETAQTDADDKAQTLQRTAAEKAVATVNAFRARHGYEPLVYSEELSAIAQAHVTELAARGAVSALGPKGQTIGVRLLDKGYNARVAGSVVAGGYPTFDAAFTSWTRNQVEASRLLHPAAKEIGFAVVTQPGSTYRTYIEAIVAAQ